MRCDDPGVVQVRVGVQQVGIVGLRDALRKAAERGLSDHEAIADFLMTTLAPVNYFPDRLREDYRKAMLREYLRHTGRDFSAHYSEIEVTVRGEEGERRDRFVEMLRSVMAKLELRPVVTFVPPDGEDPGPELIINDQSIVRGIPGPRQFEAAVHKTLSGW